MLAEGNSYCQKSDLEEGRKQGTSKEEIPLTTFCSYHPQPRNFLCLPSISQTQSEAGWQVRLDKIYRNQLSEAQGEQRRTAEIILSGE